MGQSLSVNNRMIEIFDTAMESGNIAIVELVPALPLDQVQMETIRHNFPFRPSLVCGSNRIA